MGNHSAREAETRGCIRLPLQRNNQVGAQRISVVLLLSLSKHKGVASGNERPAQMWTYNGKLVKRGVTSLAESRTKLGCSAGSLEDMLDLHCLGGLVFLQQQFFTSYAGLSYSADLPTGKDVEPDVPNGQRRSLLGGHFLGCVLPVLCLFSRGAKKAKPPFGGFKARLPNLGSLTVAA